MNKSILSYANNTCFEAAFLCWVVAKGIVFLLKEE
jgi:hypothetical protein